MNKENIITKTGLDKIESSPLDYWFHFRSPNKPEYEADEKTEFDEAFRCAVLTPEIFSQKYVGQPAINKRTNIGKAEFASLESSIRENNQIMISSSSKYPDKYDTILKMKAEVDKHPMLKLVFANGVAEEFVEFEEEISGAVVKFKSHWTDLNNNLIIHLTTTNDASETQFAKDSVNFNNHKRAAIQLDGYANTNRTKDGFLFVNVERTAPFKISILYLDEKSISLGRSVYLDNCALFMECLKSDNWPGFKPTATPVSLPDWAFKNQ